MVRTVDMEDVKGFLNSILQYFINFAKQCKILRNILKTYQASPPLPLQCFSHNTPLLPHLINKQILSVLNIVQQSLAQLIIFVVRLLLEFMLNEVAFEFVVLFFNKDRIYPLVFTCEVLAGLSVVETNVVPHFVLLLPPLKQFLHPHSPLWLLLLPIYKQFGVRVPLGSFLLFLLGFVYPLAEVCSHLGNLLLSSEGADQIPDILVPFNRLSILVHQKIENKPVIFLENKSQTQFSLLALFKTLIAPAELTRVLGCFPFQLPKFLSGLYFNDINFEPELSLLMKSRLPMFEKGRLFSHFLVLNIRILRVRGTTIPGVAPAIAVLNLVPLFLSFRTP